MFADPSAMTQFPALSDADFDAYLAARATSNTFVRARIPVKERMLELGRALAARAASRGLALEVGASDERPSVWNKKSVTCQWVFLWRDRAARAELERATDRPAGLSAALLDPTPYDKHAFLAVYLDADRFEVCLRLHRDAWADVKSAQRRLETETGRETIGATLAALPEGFVVSVIGGESLPARACDVAQLRRLLDDAVTRGSWLSIGRSMPRAEAIAAGTSVGESAAESFDVLLPAYRALAWSPDDDLAAVADDVARNRAARDAHVAEAKAREDAWTADHTAEIERRRESAVVEARERLAALERARPGAVQAATAAFMALNPAPHRPQRLRPPARSAALVRDTGAPTDADADAATRKTAPKHFPLLSDVRGGRDFLHAAPAVQPRKEAPVAELVESDRQVIVGSRVRIRQGPFTGKTGTVTELRARDARVAIGALSARVDLGDLVRLDEKA